MEKWPFGGLIPNYERKNVHLLEGSKGSQFLVSLTSQLTNLIVEFCSSLIINPPPPPPTPH